MEKQLKKKLVNNFITVNKLTCLLNRRINYSYI